MTAITGKIIKLGDDIDADMILTRRQQGSSPSHQDGAPNLDEPTDGRPERVQGNEVVVAGGHFGCGPTGAQEAAALKAAGIRCVIARSFGRGFFRQAINGGLPVVAADIVDTVSDGDHVSIDLAAGKIICGGKETTFPSYPAFVINILESGSLTAAVKKTSRKR